MKFILTCIQIILSLFASAQTNICGKIVDRDRNGPIPFATISSIDDLTGTLSDTDGTFCIPGPVSDSLNIRCVGYKQTRISASDIISNKIIELEKDTIRIGEIQITAESAYKMIARSMDSTSIYTKKLLKGYCYRKDHLDYNNKKERESYAEIIYSGNTQNNKIDYWLKSFNSKTFSKISKQPYLSYPGTIPFDIFSTPPPKKKAETKYSIDSSSNNQLIIKASRVKPTKNLITNAKYFINRKTWIIDSISYNGIFDKKPMKQWNNYHYATNSKITYCHEKDSCILETFIFETQFSHKKKNPEKLWSYTVIMVVHEDNSAKSSQTMKKLRKNDYLLFMNPKN